jgi:hypothetical protein
MVFSPFSAASCIINTIKSRPRHDSTQPSSQRRVHYERLRSSTCTCIRNSDDIDLPFPWFVLFRWILPSLSPCQSISFIFGSRERYLVPKIFSGSSLLYPVSSVPGLVDTRFTCLVHFRTHFVCSPRSGEPKSQFGTPKSILRGSSAAP